jgi:UTP--glucose-1-phosphate uridylyltransferase
MEKQLKTVLIPAAGLGTRFLPATKAVPKEMLPIVDTPAIQLVVEEAVASGARTVVMISGRHKQAIEDHFDCAYELEHTLSERSKTDVVKQMQHISALANVVSIRQKTPLGLGHAVLCGKPAIADDYFGVMLPDDLFDAEVPCMQQLWQAHLEHKKSVVALMPVSLEETRLYGVAAGRALTDSVLLVDQLVEKPQAHPPSHLAVIGRYVLTSSIFEALESTAVGVGQEIQLTDALQQLARRGELIGVQVKGQRYDVGDRLGYVQATIAYALKRPALRPALISFLKNAVS